MKLTILGLLLPHAICGQTVWFEPNQGQAHPSVQFQSRNFCLRATSAAIHVDGSPIVFTLEHANANARFFRQERQTRGQPGDWFAEYHLCDSRFGYRQAMYLMIGRENLTRTEVMPVLERFDGPYCHNADKTCESRIALRVPWLNNLNRIQHCPSAAYDNSSAGEIQ